MIVPKLCNPILRRKILKLSLSSFFTTAQRKAAKIDTRSSARDQTAWFGLVISAWDSAHTWGSAWGRRSMALGSPKGMAALSPKELTWSKSVRSSLDVAWEDNSMPLSVAGLTADEVFSELPEEMGEGASMKVTPAADEKQQQS